MPRQALTDSERTERESLVLLGESSHDHCGLNRPVGQQAMAARTVASFAARSAVSQVPLTERQNRYLPLASFLFYACSVSQPRQCSTFAK